MRLRTKKIRSKTTSELSKLEANWLDLPGVKTEGKIEGTQQISVVQAVTVYEETPSCPICRSNQSVIKWGFQADRNINDVEQNGILVVIVLRAQKFLCTKCKAKFHPPLPFLDRGNLRRTMRLTEKVIHLSHERRTISDIAVLTSLGRRTVQDIVRESAKNMPTPQEVFRQATSEGHGHVIQIDNAHPSGREYTGVLLNTRPLELLETYNEAAVAEFFVALEGRDKVTCYISDMAEFLLRLGREYYPSATIIADPHHVVRRLIEIFDEFIKPFEDAMLDRYVCAIKEKRIIRPARHRKAQRAKGNHSKSQQCESEKLRKPTAAEVRILLHTKIGETNQSHRNAVRFLLKHYPDVREAYYYLQRVMNLYHRTVSAKEASIALDKYEAKLSKHVQEGLDTFLRSCRKNRDVICAFWSLGWTNAEIESQNAVIKEIDRMARGLGFRELRRRWLCGRSMSAILQREKEKRLNKKNGPRKKSIRELRSEPPPEPVPLVGEYGQLSLF